MTYNSWDLFLYLFYKICTAQCTFTFTHRIAVSMSTLEDTTTGGTTLIWSLYPPALAPVGSQEVDWSTRSQVTRTQRYSPGQDFILVLP